MLRMQPTEEQQHFSLLKEAGRNGACGIEESFLARNELVASPSGGFLRARGCRNLARRAQDRPKLLQIPDPRLAT
jgi:hypothetical protein